jgi:uncharacterized protein YggE
MRKTAGAILVGAATLAFATPAMAAASPQISVNGSGEASVPADASYAQQQTSYDQALTAAISDASSKAQQVAQQLTLTLGPVVSFTEESVDYLGYCGFGIAPGLASSTASGVANGPSTSTAVGAPTGTQLTPIPHKSTKHKGKKRAHRAHRHAHRSSSRATAVAASDQSCQLEADVTIVYSAS